MLEQEAATARNERMHRAARVAKRIQGGGVKEEVAVALNDDDAGAGASQRRKAVEPTAHRLVPEVRKADERAEEVTEKHDLGGAAPFESDQRRKEPIQIARPLPDVEIGDHSAQHASC